MLVRIDIEQQQQQSMHTENVIWAEEKPRNKNNENPWITLILSDSLSCSSSWRFFLLFSRRRVWDEQCAFPRWNYKRATFFTLHIIVASPDNQVLNSCRALTRHEQLFDIFMCFILLTCTLHKYKLTFVPSVSILNSLRHVFKNTTQKSLVQLFTYARYILSLRSCSCVL